MVKLLQKKSRPLETAVEGSPVELTRAVDRALSLKPSQRFSKCYEFAQAAMSAVPQTPAKTRPPEGALVGALFRRRTDSARPVRRAARVQLAADFRGASAGPARTASNASRCICNRFQPAPRRSPWLFPPSLSRQRYCGETAMAARVHRWPQSGKAGRRTSAYGTASGTPFTGGFGAACRLAIKWTRRCTPRPPSSPTNHARDEVSSLLGSNPATGSIQNSSLGFSSTSGIVATRNASNGVSRGSGAPSSDR